MDAVEWSISRARRPDPPRDPTDAARRAEDLWRNRRAVSIKLADHFSPSGRAPRCRPRPHRAQRAGNSLRAQHVGLPGYGPAPDGVEQTDGGWPTTTTEARQTAGGVR